MTTTSIHFPARYNPGRDGAPEGAHADTFTNRYDEDGTTPTSWFVAVTADGDDLHDDIELVSFAGTGSVIDAMIAAEDGGAFDYSGQVKIEHDSGVTVYAGLAGGVVRWIDYRIAS